MMLSNTHSTDSILADLSSTPGTLGSLARQYPGIASASESTWLDDWFLSRTRAHFDDSVADSDRNVRCVDADSQTTSQDSALSARLLSIHPHYFRGFRSLKAAIDVSAKLVVIDGRNSSGKTSLGEAIEWLLTGVLSRREDQDHGSSRELENCIVNQFRPSDEQTWVTGTFSVEADRDSGSLTLRRELVSDYGPTSTSTCRSRLFINDRELSDMEESVELERIFGSVAPLLMQHTLRHFVESTPEKRRLYFERLLKLDQLTDLITRAVIGNARLSDFPSPTGRGSLERWRRFGDLAEVSTVRNTLRRSSNRTKEDITSAVRQGLTETACLKFSDYIDSDDHYDTIRPQLEQQQRASRARSFPSLEDLRPRVQLANRAPSATYLDTASDALTRLTVAWRSHFHAAAELSKGDEDRAAISQAFMHLLHARVIDVSAKEQTCPLCAYGEAPSLTLERIGQIQRWAPQFQAERNAKAKLDKATAAFSQTLATPISDYESLLPDIPDRGTLRAHLTHAPEELAEAVDRLIRVRQTAAASLGNLVDTLSARIGDPLAAIDNHESLQHFVDECLSLCDRLESIHKQARTYAEAFTEVEAAVGTAARRDPQYRLREAWIECSDELSQIVSEIKWEDSKFRAQRDLQSIRSCLIDFRRDYLESRRLSFNRGMQAVWSSLRGDIYSRFSQLYVPEPSGKGFLVEIEVKALLDDGNTTRELDALQVFSESQVNALGIAAFITRSELIGHRVLIFDDPVQSMDEEHFKTFARDVLGHLLGQGFQVVLLTHNDTFARDVSHCHYFRTDYITMKVRHSRREGCVVEEGNRRVKERLKLAERLTDEGRFDDAWKPVRLAIERLYLVSQIHHGPSRFKPDSWAHQTAEYRWNSGARKVIESFVPDAGIRLKEILSLAAAGSHDDSVRGETDLRRSILFLNELLCELGVGDG